MRTTLVIDDDILSAARDLARAEGKTVGEIISDLARKALTTPQVLGMSEPDQALPASSWPTLPGREGVIVTSEMVKRIQEELDLEDAEVKDFSKIYPQPKHRGTTASGGRSKPGRRRRTKS